MKKLGKISVIAIIGFILGTSLCGYTAYAYINRIRELEANAKVGHAEIVSIENPSLTNKVVFGSGEDVPLLISLNLDCNVDAVVRVKIAPKYYDSFDRTVSLPNNIIYNFDSSIGEWVSDGFNMCFYLDASVKDLETLKIMNTISFSQDDVSLYEGCSIEFVVEADILQTKGIDYENHPWKDNAPSAWLEKVKTI